MYQLLIVDSKKPSEYLVKKDRCSAVTALEGKRREIKIAYI